MVSEAGAMGREKVKATSVRCIRSRSRSAIVSVTSWNSVVPVYTLPKFTGDGEIRSVEPETLFTFCVTLADVLDANFVSPE